jgi:hypothetical protein
MHFEGREFKKGDRKFYKSKLLISYPTVSIETTWSCYLDWNNSRCDLGKHINFRCAVKVKTVKESSN